MRLKYTKNGTTEDLFEILEISNAGVATVFRPSHPDPISTYGWVENYENFNPMDKVYGELEYEPTDWNEFNNEVALFRLK